LSKVEVGIFIKSYEMVGLGLGVYNLFI